MLKHAAKMDNIWKTSDSDSVKILSAQQNYAMHKQRK